MVQTKKIAVDKNGLIVIKPNTINKDSNYDFFIKTIEACNEGIKMGFIKVNHSTMEIYNVFDSQFEKTLEKFKSRAKIVINYTDLRTLTERERSASLKSLSSHGCGLRQLDILFIGSKNYAELKNYYSHMEALYVAGMGMAPYASTVMYWVRKVKPNGEWDYKTREGYSPYYKEFCTCYDGAVKHITSEYLGNFNYGYTGKFLFSLSELHAGSFAVSGFDASDYDDWPAIDDGYNHAP